MADNLLTIFPTPKDLLALEPEELAGVLVEVIPGISQSEGFLLEGFLDQLFRPFGPTYPQGAHRQVTFALAEALSWLERQGVAIRNPTQPASWYILTRRGHGVKTRVDLETFRKGRALPVELLQQSLASKVHHLFLRGDDDTAVFQAFKEVEVAVRRAASYPDELVGRDLMKRAFHPETGPLRDQAAIPAERESEMFLFSGAIGHAKNPASHREVNLSPVEAARLIVFASYLLEIVHERAAASAAP